MWYIISASTPKISSGGLHSDTQDGDSKAAVDLPVAMAGTLTLTIEGVHHSSIKNAVIMCQTKPHVNQDADLVKREKLLGIILNCTGLLIGFRNNASKPKVA